MYSRFTLQTRLATVDAEQTLMRLVAARDEARGSKPFVGRVQDGAFDFQRVVTGRNGFLPVVTGQIAEGEGGAVVRGSMRVRIATAVVMTVWMGMAIVAVLAMLPRFIAASDIRGAVVVSFLPLFGVVLIAAGYYPERRKALQILEDAFTPRT